MLYLEVSESLNREALLHFLSSVYHHYILLFVQSHFYVAVHSSLNQSNCMLFP